MNVWQICGVLKNILQGATWPGSANVVFDKDSVRVIPQGDEIADLDEGLIPPLCLIMPLGGELDPEHREEPTLVRRTIDITLVTVNQGDRVGETPILGGQSQDTLHSQGRGLLELEAQLFAAVSKLNIQQGVVIQFSAFGEGQVRRDQANQYIGIQDYTFAAWCSTATSYDGVTQLSVSGGTGDLILSWVYPATRPSTFRARVRYKAGSSAPTSPTDGLSGGDFSGWASFAAGSAIISGLTPGTYSAAVFVTYDEIDTPPSQDLQASPAATGTATSS